MKKLSLLLLCLFAFLTAMAQEQRHIPLAGTWSCVVERGTVPLTMTLMFRGGEDVSAELAYPGIAALAPAPGTFAVDDGDILRICFAGVGEQQIAFERSFEQAMAERGLATHDRAAVRKAVAHSLRVIGASVLKRLERPLRTDVSPDTLTLGDSLTLHRGLVARTDSVARYVDAVISAVLAR